MFNAVMLREKNISYRFCFAWEVFEYKRTAWASFFLFPSLVNYRKIDSLRLQKSRFVGDVLFYPENEAMAFPKLKLNEIESAMFTFTFSLTW